MMVYLFYHSYYFRIWNYYYTFLLLLIFYLLATFQTKMLTLLYFLGVVSFVLILGWVVKSFLCLKSIIFRGMKYFRICKCHERYPRARFWRETVKEAWEKTHLNADQKNHKSTIRIPAEARQKARSNHKNLSRSPSLIEVFSSGLQSFSFLMPLHYLIDCAVWTYLSLIPFLREMLAETLMLTNASFSRANIIEKRWDIWVDDFSRQPRLVRFQPVIRFLFHHNLLHFMPLKLAVSSLWFHYTCCMLPNFKFWFFWVTQLLQILCQKITW